jgi:hypothetical protein
MRIVSATVLCVLFAFLLLPNTSRSQSANDADRIIMRLRPVCNFGQGSSLVIAFEIKARSGGVQQRVGGYSITMTYPGAKMVLQGVSQMYSTSYWPGGTWYINQAFGSNAWFCQHATQFGSPGSALPLNPSYFSTATDCQSPAQPLTDGYYEILRFNFQIGASASGTANFQMFNIQPYRSGIAFQHGTESTGIYYSDLQNNGNDSLLVINNLIVPINLSLFEATAREDGSAFLHWRTESETNNAGFEIERGDGETFETLAFVSPIGSGNSRTDYEYIDRDARLVSHNSTVFYRLKQIDNDGTASYSHITSATFLPQTVGFGQNYPNPSAAGEGTIIPVNLAVPGTVHLAVYNNLGQRVAMLLDGEFRSAGRHEISWNGLNDSKLPVSTGSYFVRLAADLGSGETVNAVRQISIVR